MDITCRNNLHFKSGLTREIIDMGKNINPKQVERYFQQTPYKDWGAFRYIDLKGNKTHAAANRLCADIFKNLRKIFDFRQGRSMQNLLFPQDLYVFNPEVSEYYRNYHDFWENNAHCRPEINKPIFDVGTVFMNIYVDSLKVLNGVIESMYDSKELSTSHFLSPYVHEWNHSFFNKLTKNRAFVYGYDYWATMQNYLSQKFTPEEKEVVSSVLGKYPVTVEYGQYSECYAEAWSKFICEALASDCKTFAKNPIDLLKKTPLEFQIILQKVSNPQMVR